MTLCSLVYKETNLDIPDTVWAFEGTYNHSLPGILERE